MTTKSQKQRMEMLKQAYNMTIDMGQVLRYARKAVGLPVAYIAQCLNVSRSEWSEYEYNQKPIPMYVIIKLVIFGMDFWARNKQCFEGMSNDHPVATRHPSTGGELGPQTNV